MRYLPEDFDPAIVAAIDARLDAVLAGGTTIGLAIESGSKAWGFASPDSDYDCRFLYVRPRASYLSLWPTRDVIETPLEGLLDVNGWDIAKALRLVVKGNAVVVEWIRSPIVYRGDPAFRAMIDAFATRYAPRDAIRRHYLHLGLGQWHRHGEGVVHAKKLFYALRPAAALRWMDLHVRGLPPMHFPTLMAQVDLPAELREIVTELMEQKARTRELCSISVPAPIATFVTAQYEAAAIHTSPYVSPGAEAAADALFLDILDRFAPA